MTHFRSTTDKLLFFLVVGGGLLFVLYLVVDSLYHKIKWRRLMRKFEESKEIERAEDAGPKPPTKS